MPGRYLRVSSRIGWLGCLVAGISLAACAEEDSNSAAVNGAGLQSDEVVILAQADPSNPQLPAGAVRVQPAKIIDRNGFGQPMTAATMMVPVGWQTQGGVIWEQNLAGCGPATPHLNWTAMSPDGLMAMQMLPEESWNGHNMQFPGLQQSPCPNIRASDPRQYFTQYVQRIRPGARVLDYRERADIVNGVNQMIPPPQQMFGMEVLQWVGAGDMLIGYSQQGQEFREMIGLVAIFSKTRMADGLGGVTEMDLTYSLPTFTFRAPEGQLDFDQAAMLRNSYRSDPQWDAQMAAHRAQMSRINAQGAADRARITAQTNQEISDIQMQTWRDQQASQETGTREFNEYIRGVETYNDPINGGTVQLDSTYENAWQLNDGTYVLTNDLSFNPYAVTGQDGVRLEPTP